MKETFEGDVSLDGGPWAHGTLAVDDGEEERLLGSPWRMAVERWTVTTAAVGPDVDGLVDVRLRHAGGLISGDGALLQRRLSVLHPGRTIIEGRGRLMRG